MEGGKPIALLAAVMAVSVAVVFLTAYRQEIAVGYRLVSEFESLGKNTAGYPEYRHLATGIVFVHLPGGECEVGTREGEWKAFLTRAGEEDCLDDGGALTRERVEARAAGIAEDFPRWPHHEVRLRPFLIAKFEITREEWARVPGVTADNSPREVADNSGYSLNASRYFLWRYWLASALLNASFSPSHSSFSPG